MRMKQCDTMNTFSPPRKMILGPGIEGAVSRAAGETSRPRGEQAPTRVSGSLRNSRDKADVAGAVSARGGRRK